MRVFTTTVFLVFLYLSLPGAEEHKLRYNNPGLVVDLGVGLWGMPMPMDYDGDGDFDLLMVSMGKVGSGTFFFENAEGGNGLPVFKPGKRIGPGPRYAMVSYEDSGRPRVFAKDGTEYRDFLKKGFDDPEKPPYDTELEGFGKLRAVQWGVVDLNGDGALDLFRAVGVWEEYGWDDAYNEEGEWTNGPLRGFVHWFPNRGTSEEPEYGQPVLLRTAGGAPVEVYGAPTPNFRDFDGDGDLDLLLGEFVDTMTYFENTGTAAKAGFVEGRKLRVRGEVFRVRLCMHHPVAFDWNRDGHLDLFVGEEDGRVSVMWGTGRMVGRVPEFSSPVYLQQEAEYVKFGVLATPVSFDWDGDGDEDIVSGNTAGEIGWIENLGGYPPKWNRPVLLKAGSEEIRIVAGPNGSIQGPAERKWGYTVLDVADWDGDGLPDLVVNSIWGKIVWYRNVGTREAAMLEEARPVRIRWEGEPQKPAWNWWEPEPEALVTQWRTSPIVRDLNEDGLMDLVMLDAEGYLALFARERSADGTLFLKPPLRMFSAKGASVFDRGHAVVSTESGLLRLNDGYAGKSGRRKLTMADWDGDGRQDLLVNSASANLLRNIGEGPEGFLFEDRGPVVEVDVASHSSSPTVVDWNRDGAPDLLIGAEDGFLYYFER